MNDDATRAMDEIMASIRSAVTSGETVLTAPMREAGTSDAPEQAATPTAPPPASLPAGETSLEGLVRALLEPMLKDWLDANLGRIVEARVQAEIARLTTR